MRITLCGSSRNKEEFMRINRSLTLAGHVVYSLGVFPHDEDEIKLTDEDKIILDAVHMAKIANSDAILVIAPDGYIGDSTRLEIAYALTVGKTVYWSNSLSDSDELHRHTAFTRSQIRSGQFTDDLGVDEIPY